MAADGAPRGDRHEAAADALVVGVVGAVGGAGASTLAAALARRAAERLGVTVLMGLDRHGGGLARLFAGDLHPAVPAPDLSRVRGRLLPGSLAAALPPLDGVHVLDRAESVPDVPVEAVRSILAAALRDVDVVVLDLPRPPDEPAVAALAAADLALVVLPGTAAALRSGRAMVSRLSREVADVRLVVRGPLAPGLTLSGVADAVGVPVQVRMRAEPGLGRAVERGEPPGLRSRSPLTVAATHLLRGAVAEHDPTDRPYEQRARANRGWLEHLVSAEHA